MPANGFDKRPQDINRKGRPKKGRALTELMREYLNREITDKDGNNVKYKELFIQQVLKKAIAGDPVYAKLVMNYIDGMPKQQHEITGEDGEPIKIEFVSDWEGV